MVCEKTTYRRRADGIWVPPQEVRHREEDYDEAGFDHLLRMQTDHFWYRGRHRFLLSAFRASVAPYNSPVSAIDLGSGCGGWVSYLLARAPEAVREIAMGDSSLRALELAGPVVGDSVSRYHVDLLRIGWRERWQVVFLLDVLEHIPDHEQVLREIHRALQPGGLLFVTAPALQAFWTYNDDFAGHQRRYSRADLQSLAATTGFDLVRSRYFMFFLSPLLVLSRARKPRPEMPEEEKHALLAHTHRAPPRPVNEALALIFGAEALMGWRLSFPWGTSILGVFRKPLGDT